MGEDEYGSLLLKLDIFTMTSFVNPYPAKVIYLNFQPLEVVRRYRDPQLHVAENYSYLFNFITNICKSMFRNTFHSQYSVKRSDVTRWKQGYITPPPLILHSVKRSDVTR